MCLICVLCACLLYLSFALVRGRGIDFRHYYRYRESVKSSEMDCYVVAVVPFELFYVSTSLQRVHISGSCPAFTLFARYHFKSF
jgi:hypothetical protein